MFYHILHKIEIIVIFPCNIFLIKIIKLSGDNLKRTEKFLINGFVLTITALFTRSISMVFNIYVSNKIGSEAVGVFSLVMSVYMFFITLATSGLSLACTYLVSQQFAKNNYIEGLKAVRSCNLFGLLLGIGSSILIILFSNIISTNWLNNRVSPIPFYLIAVGLPFIAISSVINGYFSAVRKAYKSAISQVLELLVKIVISILLLKYFSLNSVETVCICLILADVISEVFSCTFICILYKIDRTFFNKRTKITGISYKRKILNITLPVSITSYIRSGLSTLKEFIVPNRLVLFGLPYTLALSEYGRVTGMAMPVIMFPIVFISSFSSLLIPEFSSLLAKGYKKRILDVSHKIFIIALIFSLIITIVIIIFANNISFAIYQNLECARYIRILSPLILLMYLDNIIDNMLKGLNRQFKVMLCNIYDLIITITLLYFLLPILGMDGFIICIYVSEIFNFIVSYLELRKATK